VKASWKLEVIPDDHSITKINIPNSTKRICYAAFVNSLRTYISLHDGIESSGNCIFAGCIFTNFRVPPLITVIPKRMLSRCKSLFSLEMPKKVTEILILLGDSREFKDD
jgi:hypothetical protein